MRLLRYLILGSPVVLSGSFANPEHAAVSLPTPPMRGGRAGSGLTAATTRICRARYIPPARSRSGFTSPSGPTELSQVPPSPPHPTPPSVSTSFCLPQVTAHKDIITDISFSGYSCATNGSLSGHLNTTLLAELKAAGVRTHPLVGCGMPTLRSLFASPEAFITAAVSEAKAHGFEGYNLDFEPYGAPQTNADGAAYARFLDTFATALHKEGKVLSVDYFSNLPIWNLPAMNDSATDMFISMDTYVQGNETFEAYKQVAFSCAQPAAHGHPLSSKSRTLLAAGTSSRRGSALAWPRPPAPPPKASPSRHTHSGPTHAAI